MVQHLLMMNGHHDNKMAALQNLQNLASGLQNLNSVSTLIAGLQGLGGQWCAPSVSRQSLTAIREKNPFPGLQSGPSLQNLSVPPQNLLNTPLNLSLGSSGSNGILGGHANATQLLGSPQPTAMPQFILASGQLVQGIQGAQLLIPTSQGMWVVGDGPREPPSTESLIFRYSHTDNPDDTCKPRDWQSNG